MVRLLPWIALLMLACFEMPPFEECETNDDCDRPQICGRDGECVAPPMRQPGDEGDDEEERLFCLGECCACVDDPLVQPVCAQDCLEGVLDECPCEEVSRD